MSRLFSRREVLRLGAAGLLAGMFGARRARAAQRGAGFDFLFVSDIHYVNDGCRAWLQTVIRRIRELPERPAFCFLGGDLSEHGLAPELSAVRDVFKTTGLPVFGVLGNHDWNRPDDCVPFTQVFPRPRNYHFECGGWQFVALDSTRGQRVFLSSVPEHTLTWLGRTLPSLDRSLPTIVLTHFPLASNILRPVNAGEALIQFAGHDLRAVFSGHWHGMSHSEKNGVTFTTSRCCSRWRNNHDDSTEKGFLLCSVRGGTLTSRFVVVPQV